jgi:tetratricopeptide (TPR) repeat protein
MGYILYLALALVLLGTARLARSKARNPWLWIGAAFMLMFIPGLHLLAVIPMVILMFLKSPQHQARTIIESNTCPKCRASAPRHSRFCTRCGWELRTNQAPESLADPGKLSSAPAAETQAPEAVSDAPGQRQSDEGASAPAEELPKQASGGTSEEVPVAETSPAGKPVSLGAPTAAGMTERGVRLFNQGRVQESIDQFTKAIALDPNYIQAWARRAEAYARLGRGDEAAEDRRRLDALNASSSGA